MILKTTIQRDDLFPCALCENAPCTKACGTMDCAALIRSAWFDNEQGAARALPKHLHCEKCSAKCEKACVFPGHVRISRIMRQLEHIRKELDLKEKPDGKNLRTRFAGFHLQNPYVLDAPDAANTLEKCLKAFRAGVGGLILPAATQAQINSAGFISPRFGSVKMCGTVIGLVDIGSSIGADGDVSPEAGGDSLPGCLGFIPELKRQFPDRMVIATYRDGQHTEPGVYSALAEKAGADALLIDLAADQQTPEQQTRHIRTCLETVKANTKLPLILRFQMADVAAAEVLAIAEEYGISAVSPQLGSKGIFSVNRHHYVPEPTVRGKSSIGRSSGMNLKSSALAGQVFLTKHSQPGKLQFLTGTGIESWSDALDFILLGAAAVRISDVVMCYGLRVMDDLTDGLSSYLAEKNIADIAELTGTAVPDIKPAEELDRGTVMYPNISRTKCISCGRCTLACAECAAGAMTEDFDHTPMLIANRCTGCHLCIQVCPTGAITPGRRH